MGSNISNKHFHLGYPSLVHVHVGIGRAVSKALIQSGAEVIALSRTQADLDSLQHEVGMKAT